jgi:DNA-binding NarL/FixJ family response regulator
VLELVAAGASNPRIAEQLGCSVSTVKAELARLMRLLGARTRADLVSRATVATLLPAEHDVEPPVESRAVAVGG